MDDTNASPDSCSMCHTPAAAAELQLVPVPTMDTYPPAPGAPVPVLTPAWLCRECIS
jgi:hypothetical protein